MYFHWGTFPFCLFLNSKFINCSKFLVLGEIQEYLDQFTIYQDTILFLLTYDSGLTHSSIGKIL